MNKWDVPNVVEDDRGRGHNRQVEETPERSAKMRPDSLRCIWFVYVGGQYCRDVRQSEISEGRVDTVQFSSMSKNSEPSKWYS